ncbi:MAG TPA: metalloregulator ArsR/SmtB family transcription factor [Syntrophorhabdaceae bacterium]|jgi:ArsR family transcriptional regulator
MVSSRDMKVFELQSEICQTLANPKRLFILHLLKDGEMAVGDIIKAMGISKANLSQHLTILRQKGIVTSRREGLAVYYKLAVPKITEACGIMRDVLLDSLREKDGIARALQHRTDGENG